MGSHHRPLGQGRDDFDDTSLEGKSSTVGFLGVEKIPNWVWGFALVAIVGVLIGATS